MNPTKVYRSKTVELTDNIGEYILVREDSYIYHGKMMLAIPTQAVCNTFKTQLLSGQHNFAAYSGTAGCMSGVPGAGTGVYNINSVGGYANNTLTGMGITFAAFGTSANNGTFLITASTATTITTTNTASAATGTYASATYTIGDTFKLALYSSTWTGGAGTTNYDTAHTNEVGESGSYTFGGGTLTSSTPVLSSSTAVCDFVDLSFTAATITARGALIYNSSKVIGASGGAAVCVLDFGGDKTSTAGTFTITFPVPDASNAILRIA